MSVRASKSPASCVTRRTDRGSPAPGGRSRRRRSRWRWDCDAGRMGHGAIPEDGARVKVRARGFPGDPAARVHTRTHARGGAILRFIPPPPIVGACPFMPRSPPGRPCCASPTTSACVNCCARSRGGAGIPSPRMVRPARSRGRGGARPPACEPARGAGGKRCAYAHAGAAALPTPSRRVSARSGPPRRRVVGELRHRRCPRARRGAARAPRRLQPPGDRPRVDSARRSRRAAGGSARGAGRAVAPDGGRAPWLALAARTGRWRGSAAAPRGALTGAGSGWRLRRRTAPRPPGGALDSGRRARTPRARARGPRGPSRGGRPRRHCAGGG